MHHTARLLATPLVLSLCACDPGAGADAGADAGEPCTPTVEVCDGVDNDCDGTIDNEPQASQSCDDADRCTTDVCRAGACIRYPSGACDAWEWCTDVGAPEGRYRHTAVWTGDKMIVWGGSGGVDANIYRDGAAYTPASDSWEALPVDTSNGPSFRLLHTAVWTGDEMIVWGGYNAPAPYYDDGARYRPLTRNWIPMAREGAPQARTYHTAVWTGAEMIVWGGETDAYGPTRVDTGGCYDPGADAWTALPTSGAPRARAKHTAVWTGTEMIVWGGLDSSNTALASGGAYDPGRDSWRPISEQGAPPAAFEHAAVWTGEAMIVWGGLGSDSLLDTGGVYDPTSDAWTALPAAGAPSPRETFAAVWTGSELVVWGGTDTSGYDTESGGVFNPISGAWRSTTTTAVPPGRSYPSAVWTGETMIVWGGWRWNLDDTFEFVDSGGLYTP